VAVCVSVERVPVQTGANGHGASHAHPAILFLGILLIAGCVSDPMAANGPYVTAPFAWCADEARTAASQPIPKDATPTQRRAARDFHMSKACRRVRTQERAAVSRRPFAPALKRPYFVFR
jgi:hypothetical protein